MFVNVPYGLTILQLTLGSHFTANFQEAMQRAHNVESISYHEYKAGVVKINGAL